MNIREHNRMAWDRQVEGDNEAIRRHMPAYIVTRAIKHCIDTHIM